MSNDPSVQTSIIFDWLDEVLSDEGQALSKGKDGGDAGGAIKLVMVGNSGTEDVHTFGVAANEKTDVKDLAKRIVRQAEMYVEGIGGGKRKFYVRAFRNGVARPCSSRQFMVSIDGDYEALEAGGADDPRSVMSMMSKAFLEVMRINADLVKANQNTMPKIVLEMSKIVEACYRNQFETMEMLKAGVMDHDRRQAEARAIEAKASHDQKVWEEIKTVGQQLLMMHMQQQQEEKEN